jgi:hypothetical protein
VACRSGGPVFFEENATMEFFILLLFVLWGIGFFAFRKAWKESRNAHQLFSRSLLSLEEGMRSLPTRPQIMEVVDKIAENFDELEKRLNLLEKKLESAGEERTR